MASSAAPHLAPFAHPAPLCPCSAPPAARWRTLAVLPLVMLALSGCGLGETAVATATVGAAKAKEAEAAKQQMEQLQKQLEQVQKESAKRNEDLERAAGAAGAEAEK